MTEVTTPSEVETVAYGQTTVVLVETTVVTPPYVLDPEERAVEVAAQTVVEEVRVMVVAGMVYTPGVGHVVANGVGTTGGEVDTITTDLVVVDVGGAADDDGGGGTEVAGGGGK